MRDEIVLLAKSKSAFQIWNVRWKNEESENTEMVNIEEEMKNKINWSWEIVTKHVHTTFQGPVVVNILNCNPRIQLPRFHKRAKTNLLCVGIDASTARRGTEVCLCLCLCLRCVMEGGTRQKDGSRCIYLHYFSWCV